MKYLIAAVTACVSLYAVGAQAMDGVCVDSPQTNCALYYNPPTTGGGYTGGRTYYPPRKSAAEIEAELNRENANAFNRAGNRHYEKGRYAEAIKDYEMALRFDPGNSVLKENLRDARRMLSHEQAMSSNKAGIAAYEKGNLEAAVKHYRAALRNAPDDRNIKANLEDAEREWNQKKEEKRQVKEADSEIQKGIDDLRDAIADTPSKQGKSKKAAKGEPQGTQTFGIKAGHEGGLDFMTPGEKVAPGSNRKAGDQLKNAAESGKAAGGVLEKGGTQADVQAGELSFMESSAENTKHKAGQAFEEGGKSAGSLPVVSIGGMPPRTPLQQQISRLSPQDQQLLAKDPEVKKWQQDMAEADEELPKATQKVEEKQKAADAEQDSRKRQLIQIELGKLTQEQKRLEATKRSAEVNIAAKVKTMKSYKIEME